jgi:glycosyltransferase involved in cell wall biosynthesis
MQLLVGDNTMIVQSYAAAREWKMGIPLIRGADAANWYPQKKEPRVFTVLPECEFDTYYNKNCLKAIGECLYNNYGYILKCFNYNVLKNSTYAHYKNYLERSLLFLDTSLQTPMNHARTEAFLSGCCVIQLEGAPDIESWFTQGEDIIIVPNDPERIATLIADLLENGYEDAVRIGRNGRKTAIRFFDNEEYKKSWLHLFENAIQSSNCYNK